MKKLIIFLILLIFNICCFAEKVGEEIYYVNTPLEYSSTDTYLTKVEPVMGSDGYYSVELTTIVSPAGSTSAVGLFTIMTHYILKEKDKIVLYKNDFRSKKPTTLVVSKIANNEIEFSTISDILNSE